MRISALLAAFAIMSIAGVAPALTEGVSRRVTVAGEPAGTTIFVYFRNFDGPTGSCAYDMFWESPYAVARPAECVVRELKMIGQTSCLANRLVNVTTSVTSVLGCWGFDQFGLVGHVALVLGESDAGPTLTGIAVFEVFPFLPEPITIE
jgi:hypothetical protein